MISTIEVDVGKLLSAPICISATNSMVLLHRCRHVQRFLPEGDEELSIVELRIGTDWRVFIQELAKRVPTVPPLNFQQPFFGPDLANMSVVVIVCFGHGHRVGRTHVPIVPVC